jgi:hypothetical protein
MFRIGGNTFYDPKNKIPMKILEFKRSGIELFAKFCGIPNGFPNQGTGKPFQSDKDIDQVEQHCMPILTC